MAERRMFAKTIIDSDAFLDMPLSAQSLYFHLGMRADDDGFVNNPKKITRMIGANDDDLKLLISKHFIIGFDSGVVVVKHWKIHNSIRSDRYKETVYIEEKAQLSTKGNDGYTLTTNGIPNVNQVTTNGIPSDNQWYTQDRIGKDRIGKDNCCSREIWERLSLEEIKTLCTRYENAEDLIQAVAEDVNIKGKNVENAYTYIIGYAQNKRWPTCTNK
jgi:hypothetical protein